MSLLKRIFPARRSRDRNWTAAAAARSGPAGERFSAIFQSSPVGIAFSTRDGRFIEVNPEFCSFFGYRRQEVIGRTDRELLLWANQADGKFVNTLLRSGKRLRNYEVKLRRKSGEFRTALVSIELLRLADQPARLITLVDIAERKALEAQLHRAQRIDSVGQLASGIAHDLNNLLAPIMMSTPLLRLDPSPAGMEKTLSMIEICAHRGAALVRQLMIFGRGIEGERRPVRPGEIVAEVTKLAEQTFPRNLTIVTQVPPGIWPVRGDVTQLQQVLLNLCVNARDAMKDGGVLTLSTENVEIDSRRTVHPDAKSGRYVLIRVADTGTGIAPEIIDRIFDPFFTTKETGTGSGLGLSNVLGIVRSHGGFVLLNSTVGRGTRFEVHLPASPGLESTPWPETAAAPARGGRGQLLMVVDDEEYVRAVLRETFEWQNYKVVTARDGVEAAAIFATHAVELVVTDLDMPLMDGLHLSRVLRRVDPTAKIVISTGLGGRDAKQRRAELEALGVSAILTKPYTTNEILHAVHTALSREKKSRRKKSGTTNRKNSVSDRLRLEK